MRAVSAPAEAGEDGAAAVVAVSIGSDRSTFAVSDGRTCDFTRVLEWGGGSLDVAVARELGLAPSEAEPIKRAVGLEGGEPPAGVTAEQGAQARDALRREVQTFARELVSSLQFYQNQPGSLSIAEIVVTGGTAHLTGLAEQLQKLIGVRVRVADPLEQIRTAKRLKGSEQIGSLTIAIGLGIESPMRAVNLLIKDVGPGARRAQLLVPIVALAGGAAVAVGVGALYVTSSSTLASQRGELVVKQGMLAALPRQTAQPTPELPGAALAGERAPRVAAVSSALSTRVSWDRILRRFSLVLPDDVWLQSMSLASPDAAAAASAEGAAEEEPVVGDGSDVTITGRTYSHAGVARLLARLAAVPDFVDVQLQTSRRLPDADPAVVEFTILASVRTDGESA